MNPRLILRLMIMWRYLERLRLLRMTRVMTSLSEEVIIMCWMSEDDVMEDINYRTMYWYDKVEVIW